MIADVLHKMMKKGIIAIRVAILAAALFMPIRAGIMYLCEAGEVDGCLDMGGSFNYETMTCDFENSHPYVSFSSRHPHLFTKAGISFLAGMMLFTGTMIFSRKIKTQNKSIHGTREELARP